MRMNRLFKLYDRYNEEFFNGILPFVDIVVKPLEDVYAFTMHQGDSIWIEISEGLNVTEEHDTLLHEMVHVWQAVTERKMSHGKSFKNKAKQICKATGIARKKF